MEKIRLKNGNTYEIEGGATEQRCSMRVNSLSDAKRVIEDFAQSNMETMEFLSESGDVYGNYSNKRLDEARVKEVNGGYRLTLYMTDTVPASEEILGILLGGEIV